MNSLLWWLAINSITVALMIPLVMLLSRLFQNRPAVRHLLWMIVLLKFVTPPMVTWGVRFPNFEKSRPTAEMAAKSPANEIDEAFELPDLLKQPTIERPIIQSLVHAKNEVKPLDGAAISWRSGLVGVWLLGAGVWLLNQIRRHRGQARNLKQATPAPEWLLAEVVAICDRLNIRPPKCVVIPGSASPFVWCVGKPKVVWPIDFMDADSARSILAHELAHIRRGDHWVAWLELFAGAIAWWNPLYYVARKRLRESAEMACDALALQVQPDQRRAYAEFLLSMSSVSPVRTPPAVLGVGSDSHASFERRLTMILSDRVAGTVSVRGLILAAALAIVALPGCVPEQSREQPAKADPTQQPKPQFETKPDNKPQPRQDLPVSVDPTKQTKPLPESKKPNEAITRTPANSTEERFMALPDLSAAGKTLPTKPEKASIDLSILDIGERLLQAEANLKIAKSKFESARLEADIHLKELKNPHEGEVALIKEKISLAKIELERAERQMLLFQKFIKSTVRMSKDRLAEAEEELRIMQILFQKGSIPGSQPIALQTKVREAAVRVKEMQELEVLMEQLLAGK